MDKQHPSSSSPLLQSQPPIGGEAYPRTDSSHRLYGSGCKPNSVNDSIGYESLDDSHRRVTRDEGQDNNPATDVEESRLRIIFRKVKRSRGLALSINAVLFYSFHGLFLDFMTKELNPFQISVMTFPVPLMASLFLIICMRISPTKKYTVMVFYLLGGISLFSSICCFTFCFKYLPLGDAIAIANVSLILVIILSWIILREPLRLLDLLLAFIALAGVVCIARPSFIFGSNDEKPSHSNILVGTAFGLGTALSSSALLVIVRKLSQLGQHSLLRCFANSLIVELINGIICLSLGQWQKTHIKTWLWCLGSGAIFFVAQISMYIALSNESATLVNMVCTLQIVLSFLMEFVFFHVVPSWTSAVGGGLIMLASVGAVTKKPVEDERQTSE